MQRIRRLNASIVDTIGEVLERGRREGTLRAGVDPVELHMTIAALGWFEIANRHTFGYLFKRDFGAPATVRRDRARVIDVVWQYVRERPAGTGAPAAAPIDR
jgi:hypothetical protein